MSNNILNQEEVQKRIRETFAQNVELISPYVNKRTKITLKCHDCEHIWETTAQNVLYGAVKAHHCPNCGIIASKKVPLQCANCGKEIWRRPSEIKKNQSGYFYCGRECGNQHKNKIRLENGEWDNSNNYRGRAMKAYEHKCFCCGWDEDPRILEAHHIDEDRTNVKTENLCLLCPTCHRKITLGYYVLDIKARQLIIKNKGD